MTDINTDIYETDENGEVVKNKDGSPRKKRGRRKADIEGSTPHQVVEDEAVSFTEVKTLQGQTLRTVDERREAGVENVFVPEAGAGSPADPFTAHFLGEVMAELEKVFEKYGEQNRPFLAHHFKRFEYRNEEARYKQEYDFQSKNGGPSWDTILLEEVYESLAAGGTEARIGELVQVAAMATLAAASLHRESQVVA